MKNQKGFTLVEGLLIVLILSVIGFAGYTVWNNNQDDEVATQNSTETAEQNTEQKEEEQKQEVEEASLPDGWTTYTNETLGFSFDYPEEYGSVNEESSYGSENKNALRYTFYFDNICPTCEGSNPFAEEMDSDGIVEIGATTADFGGIGTGRPYASSAGFDGEGNFQAVNTMGLLTTTDDGFHSKARTSIEFNLTKSTEATGIMFMTNDTPGETSNAENLKTIAETFEIVD